MHFDGSIDRWITHTSTPTAGHHHRHHGSRRPRHLDRSVVRSPAPLISVRSPAAAAAAIMPHDCSEPTAHRLCPHCRTYYQTGLLDRSIDRSTTTTTTVSSMLAAVVVVVVGTTCMPTTMMMMADGRSADALACSAVKPGG